MVFVFKWIKEACKEFRIQGQLSVLERPTDIWEPHKYRVQNDSSPLDRITGKHTPQTAHTTDRANLHWDVVIKCVKIAHVDLQWSSMPIFPTALSELHSKDLIPMKLKRKMNLQSAWSRWA